MALNGLEFNKIFTKGIDYLRKDEEEKALKWELDALEKKGYEGAPMRVDAKDKDFVKAFTEELKEFNDNPEVRTETLAARMKSNMKPLQARISIHQHQRARWWRLEQLPSYASA